MKPTTLGALAVMDYMKVVNRLQDPYIAAEKAWKPIHQKRIEQEIIEGWYLYKVHFAYDANPYNFATINTYGSFEKLENPYPKKMIAETHPDKGYDGFEDLTEESRKKVRSEMSRLVVSSRRDSLQEFPSKYLKVAFIQVKESDQGAYIQGEKDIWKAAHEVLIEEGIQDWWAVYQLDFPHGNSVDYQFLTISGVSSFEKLNQLDYFGAFQKAHPSLTMEDELAKTQNIRTTYRAELWELVDSLEK
ncbi:MAG: hypothetical protein AAFY71_18830 [Bacteroidota bacterium]